MTNFIGHFYIGFAAACENGLFGFLSPPQAGLNDFWILGQISELRFQRGEEKIYGDNVEGRRLVLTYSAMMGSG